MNSIERNKAYMIIDRHKQLIRESSTIDKEIIELKANLGNITDKLTDLRLEEKNFLQELENKYGKGSIDPSTFEYITS